MTFEFIGNHDEAARPFLEQAAEETGYSIQVLTSNQTLPNDKAGRVDVYCLDARWPNLSLFWSRYRELRDAAQQQPDDGCGTGGVVAP